MFVLMCFVLLVVLIVYVLCVFFVCVFISIFFWWGVVFVFCVMFEFFCLYLLCTWARPVGRAHFILCKFVLINFWYVFWCLLISLLCLCLSIFGFVMLGFVVALYLCVFGCDFFVLLILVLVWFDGY